MAIVKWRKREALPLPGPHPPMRPNFVIRRLCSTLAFEPGGPATIVVPHARRGGIALGLPTTLRRIGQHLDFHLDTLEFANSAKSGPHLPIADAWKRGTFRESLIPER
jgi:hypothetical protein